MDKPTDEQIKEFWEWCGFTHIPYQKDDYGRKLNDDCWLLPGEIKQVIGSGNWSFKPPPIDLNNLFKYAVLKLDKVVMLSRFPTQGFWTAKLGATIQSRDSDPALALFWAIYEVTRG